MAAATLAAATGISKETNDPFVDQQLCVPIITSRRQAARDRAIELR
jgi:hypothetical protein